MLIKILIIAAAIGLILFVVLPKRPVPQAPIAPRKEGSKLVVSLLASAAILLGILALFCFLLWLGGLAGVMTGGGEVMSGNGLLRIMGVLLLLAIACAIGAWLKRRS
jgi:hypothetical protein